MAKRNFRSRETKFGFIFEDKTVQMIWFHGFNDEEPASSKFLGIYEVHEILKDISPTDYPMGYPARHNFMECIAQLRLELIASAKYDNVLYVQYTDADGNTQINMNKPLEDVDMLRMLNLALLDHGRFQLQPMWSEDEEKGLGKVFSSKEFRTKPRAFGVHEVKK